jgi:hypothetical protein
MTSALGAHPEPAVTPGTHSGKHKRSDRRQRTTEKILAGLVLLVAFLVTVLLLGLQWLGNQGTVSSAPISTSHSLISEVQPS